MCENFISSLHIQKLGHKIEEIRVRALNNILSKFDHGIVSSNDFSRYLEMLKKLLHWFDFESVPEQEKVLNLVARILQSEIGSTIIKHIGPAVLIKDIKQVQSKICERYHPLVDSITQGVLCNSGSNVVPPLISDLPLSFRSDQTINQQYTNRTFSTYSNRSFSQHTARSFDQQSNKSYSLHSEKSQNAYGNENRLKSGCDPCRPVVNDRCGSTASSITGVAQKSSSVSGVETGHMLDKNSTNNSVSPVRDLLYKSIPFVTLNWQSLVKSDSHVLKSVEDSLQNPPQPSVLLHSCEFFCNVMLQDFPAEVFLQRPAVLTLFYEMINTCPSTRITNYALLCLNKLTENLIVRIRYYSDPCTHNWKHGTCLMFEPANGDYASRKTFNYNIDVNKPLASDSESDDSCVLQCTQISLPQYCIKTFFCVLTYVSEKPESFREGSTKKKTQSGINTALQLVDKLVTLTTLCIKPSIWDSEKDATINEVCKQITCLLEKLGDVLEQFRLMVVASDMEYFERMAQLHLLHSTSYLLAELIPLSRANKILPRQLKCSLSSSLLDASFGRLYPAAHESLLQYVNVFSGQNEAESLTKYRDVQEVCRSMTKAVKVLKYVSNYSPTENLQLIHGSLPSFEFHKNLSVINTFLKICVKCNEAFSADDAVQKLIEGVLVTFLNHTDEDIRKETYYLCQKLIVNILGINHTKHISETDPGSQVVFFFRPNIFIEIAAHGLTSDLVQVQTYAEDILIHLLKCKFLVSESVWKKLIKALLQALPILQCYTDFDTPLGRALVKMMDPDVSPTLFLPTIDVLKGNLRMLFCKDVRLRNEAVARLCWLLSTEEDAAEKIPKIKSLQDCGLSNIFQIEYPIDLSRKRGTNQFYQVSSLQQVLELLCVCNIEPSIRRSALTQISVMLEDHFMHAAFLEQNGLKLVLNILKNSLNESEYHNYPDSVIPVIAILKNICLNNSVIRQELSHDVKLMFRILRALFLYCTDKRMQQDGAILCCLLLFSEFVVYNPSGTDPVGLSLPDVIAEKFYIPFKCHTHWKTSRYSKPSLFGLLMSDNWCKSTLRMHWNIEWYGGISELILWTYAPSVSTLSSEQLAEFSADLRLTTEDLLALKASSVIHCCQRFLYDIENATTHQTVLEAVRGTAGYVNLWMLANKLGIYSRDESLLKLSWNSAFLRFLSAPPANADDQSLLVEIIRFLVILLKLFKTYNKSCWITEVLQDPAHYLSKLLQIDVKNEQRSISLELLALIADCSTLEQHLLDVGIISSHQLEDKTKSDNNWLHIIQIITENLKFSDTEQFYNLAYLDKLLSCLVQITSNIGWSDACSASESHRMFSDLIEALSELLTAFHCGKGAEAASSFMGINITRNSLLTMNHILCEMQRSLKKNWESYWVSDTVFSATLFSLFSLWSCRDVVVRAATVQLLAGLASSPRGATVIVENVRQRQGGVWETTLMILIDHSEASVVREQAAVLLANLCSHINSSGCGQATLPLCHAPLTITKGASPMETVMDLLREYHAFEELNILLCCIHLDSTFEPSLTTISQRACPRVASGATTVRSYVPTSTESSSVHTQDNGVDVFVTPSLAKSVANFISNLLFLAPERVTEAVVKHGLVRSFFRCLTHPSLDLTDSRQYLLYSDTLEMSTAICALLTRCVLVSTDCRTIVLHTRDCLLVLLSLLNPALFNTDLPHFLYLRNQLWCEIFRLLTAILDTPVNKNTKEPVESSRESFNILSSLLVECGYEPFFKSLYESIESKTAGLQKSALLSLTSLLTKETKQPENKGDETKKKFSFQCLLDKMKTPREKLEENSENVDPQILWSKSTVDDDKRDKSQPLIETYRSGITTEEKVSRSEDRIPSSKTEKSRNRFYSEPHFRLSDKKMNMMVGADLCRILLKLYQMSNLEVTKDGGGGRKKGVVIGALSSVLSTSDEAKKCALKEGLLPEVVTHLKNLHVELSVHSAEALRKVSDKKKVSPLLKEVENHFGLLTNFMVGNDKAKNVAASLGLADLVHKYWLWFCFERPMVINLLKMLCTFTTSCDQASHSLTLTNPTPGSGPRKVATNISLLTAVINLVMKEMELISRSHDIMVLQLSFHVLQNVCAVLECRTVIAKSNLFHCINRLHPAITKRQRPWEAVELLWLEFLEVFTFFAEGQVHVTKSNDTLELLFSLTSSPKPTNKLSALSVLRNVSFHHSNRTKLLASVEFIQVLHNKLVGGTPEERDIVVSMMWALVANSQRSKMVIKCAGLDARLQEIIKQYEMQGVNDKSYQMMTYVYALLKDGER